MREILTNVQSLAAANNDMSAGLLQVVEQQKVTNSEIGRVQAHMDTSIATVNASIVDVAGRVDTVISEMDRKLEATADSASGVHKSIGDIVANLDRLRTRVLRVEECDKENNGGDGANEKKREGATGEPLAVSGNATAEPLQRHE